MRLIDYYDSVGIERVGLIKKDGTVIELENTAANPYYSFSIEPRIIIDYEDEIAATWHTHPGSHANLSLADYETFLAWPQFDHYIIGSDAILGFYVKDGVVFLYDETGPPRISH